VPCNKKSTWMDAVSKNNTVIHDLQFKWSIMFGRNWNFSIKDGERGDVARFQNSFNTPLMSSALSFS
jgi:hypothetical protein